MKYFVFITVIMLMLTACTQQSGPDKTTVSEDLPNIKLVFEPYDFEFAETPDLSDWQRMPDANYDNLLGYPVRIEKYRCDLPGEMYGTYYIHGIHKETSESLFTMLREISCYDVDNDGCYEMGFGDRKDEVVMYYMVKRVGEELEFAEINMPFVEYILKHLNKDADFTYYTRLDGNFGYTVYSENHKAHTDHFLYAEFYGNGYNITYERSFSYAGDVPFESNSPEWTVEIGYDEIVSRGGQPMKIGKLLLHGPDGQLYIYTEDDIPMNLSADTIHARELIVHPDVPYAVLIVPYFTEFAEDMQGTCLYLLDLASGEIVERITPLSIYLEGNPNIEEAKTTLGKTDILGFATHRFENQVQTTNNGFQIIVQLCNADDTEVAHNTIDVTLPIQSKIAIPDLADKVYYEPSVITTNSTIWLPEIINKEYKVFATEQLEYAIACAPTHKWKYDSDISYYVHDSGMRVRKYDLMLYRLIRVPKGISRLKMENYTNQAFIGKILQCLHGGQTKSIF